MREWQTFVRVAERDAFTAPAAVLRKLLAQSEVAPAALTSCRATSYEDEIRVADPERQVLGAGRPGRLWRVEPGVVNFLRDYRASTEYRDLEDGDALAPRFDTEGFGDFF